MDESLKRRLVGATVLVSLIVIFVPMLLEDESGQPPVIEGSNIPPRPDRESGFTSSRILPLEDQPLSPPPRISDLPEPEVVETQPVPVNPDRPPVWQDRPAPGAESGRETAPDSALDRLSATPESIAEPPISGMPETVESEPQPRVTTPAPAAPAPTEPVPRPLEPRPVKRPAPPPAQPPRAVARPQPAAPKTPVTAWAVQVGSFSDRGNADKLVRELQAARYPAFQEETQLKGDTLYRVRVGPEADRELADAMAAGIAKRFKLNGRVVSYP